MSVTLGAAGFLHALCQLDQDDVVSCGWLVGSSVGDGAGKSFRKRKGAK
jgi:hypothetical protein